jgi:hypothetical protein
VNAVVTKNTPLFLAIALVIAACSGADGNNPESIDGELRAPTGAVFELALWPGEGIPEFAATGAPLLLRDQPHLDARIHDTLVVSEGEPIGYEATSYQTITPARIEVLAADSISGRDFGMASTVAREEYYDPTISERSFAVGPSTILELLQHRAEGSCLIRIDGRVVEAITCPTLDGSGYRAAGEPVVSWWIYVVRGPSAGWVEVRDDQLRLTGRRL